MQQPTSTRERVFADISLLAAAAIWGGGFVAQRVAAEALGFFAFNGIRFLMAGLVLLPMIILRRKEFFRHIKWVLLSGLILFAASTLQQAGIETTTAGAAGFITGVYVVLVPLFLALFWKQPTSPAIWVAAVAALAGTYLLSTGGEKIESTSGDWIVLAGSFIWALHVIVVGIAVRKMDVFAFSAGQFLFSGLLHLSLSSVMDPPTPQAVASTWQALLYAGLMSAALGFTLQAFGQRKAPASDAALILNLEAVFSAIAGALLLHERMNWVQITGCAIIMAALLFAQFFTMSRRRI